MTQQKNYVGIVRDHSGSMAGVHTAAKADYNQCIESIRSYAGSLNIDTVASVAAFGMRHSRPQAELVVKNSSITALAPLTSYPTEGGCTPLFDAIGLLIQTFESVPDANDPNVSFLIMVVTDGYENASTFFRADRFGVARRRLEAKGNWSFVFRVPKGGAEHLTSIHGVPRGNILEWETTEQGMRAATTQAVAAVENYYKGVSQGVRQTEKFFADLSNVTPKDVQKKMLDISQDVLLWPVTAKDDGESIKDFVNSRLKGGEEYAIGAAFYQLVKTEKVQSHKRIMIRDKTSLAVYEGDGARNLLKIPLQGEIRLTPGSFGNFDLYIQSTSVNRKVDKGTHILYWKASARGSCHVCGGKKRINTSEGEKACPRCGNY